MLTSDEVKVVDELLGVLRRRGVADFQGGGLVVRMGPEPLVRTVLVPMPVSPDAPQGPEGEELQPQEGAPLSLLERAQLLEQMDPHDPLFDAVRRSP